MKRWSDANELYSIFGKLFHEIGLKQHIDNNFCLDRSHVALSSSTFRIPVNMFPCGDLLWARKFRYIRMSVAQQTVGRKSFPDSQRISSTFTVRKRLQLRPYSLTWTHPHKHWAHIIFTLIMWIKRVSALFVFVWLYSLNKLPWQPSNHVLLLWFLSCISFFFSLSLLLFLSVPGSIYLCMLLLPSGPTPPPIPNYQFKSHIMAFLCRSGNLPDVELFLFIALLHLGFRNFFRFLLLSTELSKLIKIE